MRPHIIGIAGPSSSGKSELARHLVEKLPGTAIVSLDSYYRGMEEIPLEARKKVNFDHPDALDWTLLHEHLKAMAAGEAIGRRGWGEAGNDALFLACVGDQTLGQLGGFAGSHHPTHHVAAEDVQDDVEVEVSPLGRPQQLRYVPGPNLVGAGGQQFRLLVLRMTKLVAALLQLSVFSQDA